MAWLYFNYLLNRNSIAWLSDFIVPGRLMLAFQDACSRIGKVVRTVLWLSVQL